MIIGEAFKPNSIKRGFGHNLKIMLFKLERYLKKSQVMPLISFPHVTTTEEEENICCWSNGESLVHRFCLDSSLHGLKYIGQPNRLPLEKLFWFCAFIISVICGAIIIVTLWQTYWNSPVVTVFQPTATSVDVIPFPAIVICNINNIRRSRANQYIQQARIPSLSLNDRLKAYGDLYDLNHICEASTTFSQRFNISVENGLDHETIEEVLRYRYKLPPSDPTQILRKATQNCSEMILLCLWLDEIHDCSSLFRGVETDYGFCCIFNVVPLTLLQRHRFTTNRILTNSRNDDRDNPATTREWDAITRENNNNILQPAIDQVHADKKRKPLPKYPYRQIYHGRSSGLSILLDPDLDEYFCKNTDANGFVIGAGSSLDFPRVRDHGIAVRPSSETFMSIKPDLTIADPSIFSFAIEKRQCYLSKEYSLKYYSYYTESNCVDECIANYTFQLCSCVQYYMPRSDNQQICSPDQFECTEKVRKDIVQKGLLRECHNCLPSCNDISYNVETTFLDMHNDVFGSGNFPGLNRSLNGRNMTIVHLYMGVVSTYPRLRKEVYSFIDLISSTGGLLSLCLGFSIISLLEICYFGTIRVCILTCKKYSKKKLRPLLPQLKPPVLDLPLNSISVSSGNNNVQFSSSSTWNANNEIDRNSQSPLPDFGKEISHRQFTITGFQILN